MIPLNEMIDQRPWAKYLTGNLVHTDLLGNISQAELDKAVLMGAIVIQDNILKVASQCGVTVKSG